MENLQQPLNKPLQKDNTIFWLSLLVLAGTAIPLLLYPNESQSLLNQWKIAIEDNFGFVYQLLAIAVLVFIFWIAGSRYGHIRFGTNDYNFSTYSWASMLFCAGVATGILYWGTIEWAYYIDTPPFGLTPGSDKAIEFAATYGTFHWGLATWGFYCLPAIAIGYSYYVKKIPLLRISVACKAVLGKQTEGPIGKVIDVLFMVGLLGSTGTSMGLGIPMITEGVATIFEVSATFGLKIVVIFFCAIIFSISVYMGLGKGIKRLSNFNTIAAFLFLTFVLIVGPTAFILKMGLNSFGLLIQNYIRMLTWTDPLTDARFVEDWSIFYWAWAMAVAPFMGIFIAKISGGRTIRSIIFGTLFFGSMGCALFYAILGNYAMNLELTGQLPILEMVRAGQAAQAIIAIIASLGSSKLVLTFFCLMSVVFVATSFDSTSYTLASCATQKIEAHQDPARWQRLFWAFVLILLPIALMYVGSLEALKIAVLISALPLTPIFILFIVSLFRDLTNHYKAD